MFARNVGIPLDLLTRAMKGGGAIPRPTVRRRYGILFGFCLRDDRDGIKLAFSIRGKEKVIYLKRYPKPTFVKAPEMACPSMLTEVPTGKIYEPEDIISGEPEPVKLIEPEDM